MRVLVVGAAGMLGRELTELIRATQSCRLFSLDLPDIDIANPRQVRDTFHRIRPDVTLNCAAQTDVDGCERDPKLAFRVNAHGPHLLAQAALNSRSLLVHVSTDFVFDGKKRTPYVEDDEPNPLSVYGKSKLAGELAVQETGCDYIIARTSWLYGPYGKNFVWSFVIARARKGEPLPLVTDQTGSPSYTLDVADAIIRLVHENARGLFHVCDGGACSRIEFATAALAEAGLKADIRPIGTQDLNLPAPRPAYSVLSTDKVAHVLQRPMPGWKNSLKKFIKRMKTLDNPRPV